MPTSFTATWSHHILNSFLRAAATGMTNLQASAVSGLRYRNCAPADWNAASNGEASITGSLAMTHANTGTCTSAGVYANGPNKEITTSAILGTAASGLEVATSNLESGTVITNSTTPAASNLTRFKVGFPKSRSTVQMNLALRNTLVDRFTGKVTSHFAANGYLRVYDGSAPDVDSAPTGTMLIEFPINTTNTPGSFSYNAPATDACTLVSSIAANAAATGTVGYARLIWNFGGTDYVIQGTIGTSGTDFIMSAASLTSGNSYDLTNATISFA